MYHHRYQPPSHLAKNNTVFSSNNSYTNNSSYSSSSSSSTILANATTTHQINNNNFNNSSSSTSYHPTASSRVEERQDVIFRRVRGILNKITPETFDKLSKELVNVGLDSPRTLRGVIYLLFDKALKDLKYSSLYAKLCQELSEKAPNFEQEPGPNTFCKFLISKCEDEFERRRKATEDFDNKNELTDEEFELKAIAKQKMLGNIKFICELGKKRLLQEEILHECIRGLLSKKKERPIQDQAQDLECLCQIMRTIGSLLDIQASRNLMNQYFDRIDMFSRKSELPSRIRFMLKDVIDLRNNNWRPRPFQREDNVPQPLSKLREEAGYDASAGSAIERFGNNRNMIGIGDLSKLNGNKLSVLLDDEPSFTTTTDFHWGPSFLAMDHPFDPFSSNSTSGIKHSTMATASTSNLSTSNSLTSQTPKPPNLYPRESRDPFSGSFEFHRQQQLLQLQHQQTKLTTNHKRSVEAGGSAFERRPFSDPNIVNMVQDRESNCTNIRSSRPPVAEIPQRANFRENDFRFNSHHQPPVQVRKFAEPGQTRESVRGFISSPPMRRQTRRQLQESNQQFPPQRAPAPSLNPPHLPAQQSYRPETRGGQLVENIDINNRKPNRTIGHPDQHDLNSRFTNQSNSVSYRQFRNDRGSPMNREHHYFERSSQPESEINLNWRASGSQSNKITTMPINSNIISSTGSLSTQKQVTRSEKQAADTRVLGGDKTARQPYVPPNVKISEISKNSNEPLVNERRPVQTRNPVLVRPERDSITNQKNLSVTTAIVSNATTHQQKVEHKLVEKHPNPILHRTHVSPLRQQILPPLRHPQTHDLPQISSTNQITQSQVPSRQNFTRHNPRTTQNENSEKRESQPIHPSRRYNQSGGYDDNKPPRFSDEKASFREEQQTFRQIINRNQLFDAPPKNEQDRSSNWRKGSTFISSNTTPKELVQVQNQTPSTITPLLPKPPAKVIDANFSLRPSHNLAGRSSGILKPVQSSTKTPSDNLLINSAQVKEGQIHDPNNKSKIRSANTETQEDKETLLTSQSVGVPSTADIADNSTQNSPTRAAARDFHVNKFISVVSDCTGEFTINFPRIAGKVKELKIPKNYQPDCLVSAMKHSIVKSENDRDNTGKLFVQLIPTVFEAPSLLKAFKLIFEKMPALEVETPKVKSLVAGFLSQSILDGILTLEDVANVLSGGRHHPLFLLCLQKLERSAGQAWLNDRFMASRIVLMNMLPEADRSKDRLASILKDRCLGFLDPMLTIEPDLWNQMKERDPSPTSVYRWIRENVDSTIQSTPLFAHVLMSCLLKYIHNVVTEKTKSSTDQKEETCGSSNKSSPSSSSFPTTNDLEKELLTKYQQVLQAILADKQMQLASLYALQLFYYNLEFPKGALLRWFHMLYDMNIVDDDIFFQWKEEINDEFPGKGQALFQVNTWLNWLAETESEEDEEEEEEE